MKLNHDCVRDVLLTVEESLTPFIYLSEIDLFDNNRLQKYSDLEITYTCNQLANVGFIDGHAERWSNGMSSGLSISIKNMTWKGHEFLDNIRDNKSWSAAKKISSTFSSISVTLMADLARDYIKKKLGL